MQLNYLKMIPADGLCTFKLLPTPLIYIYIYIYIEEIMLLFASASLGATARNADALRRTLSALVAATMVLIAKIKVYSYRYIHHTCILI